MGRPSKYPEAFRREAVALALSSDDSRASVARRLGVNETTLRNWVADHLAEEARQADPLAVRVSEFGGLRRRCPGGAGVCPGGGGPRQAAALGAVGERRRARRDDRGDPRPVAAHLRRTPGAC